MISETDIVSITEWARKRDRKNAETLKILALAYIRENKIDWNTVSGKGKLVSYIEKFYYGETKKKITFKDEWKGHQPDQNPFDLSLDEIFFPDTDDEVEIDDVLPKHNQDIKILCSIKEYDSEKNGYLHRIKSLNYPLEIKEILKELDDNAYKSPILSNLDTHGRLKLIRKAKILLHLQKQTGQL